jgi:hypothetical protein
VSISFSTDPKSNQLNIFHLHTKESLFSSSDIQFSINFIKMTKERTEEEKKNFFCFVIT